ncbi:ribonuclease HII [soil metagenome]
MEHQPLPDLSLENAARAAGHLFMAGADEAGRGCLAGPVVAAAVVLPPNARIPGLNDSKLLKARDREALIPIIQEQAIATSVAWCSIDEIERLNILWASLEAMRKAVHLLAVPPTLVLVDGNRAIPNLPCAQKTVVKGDSKSMSIAAASVLAKVTRDAMMVELDQEWPQYGWRQHKGYATRDHYEALRMHGPSPHHRASFRLA